MNEQRRQAAIEAVSEVLIAHQRHRPEACLCGPLPLGSSHAAHVASFVIDAAAPHLVGEPIGWAALAAPSVDDPERERILTWTPEPLDVALRVAAHAVDTLGNPTPARVVALIPIEDAP